MRNFYNLILLLEILCISCASANECEILSQNIEQVHQLQLSTKLSSGYTLGQYLTNLSNNNKNASNQSAQIENDLKYEFTNNKRLIHLSTLNRYYGQKFLLLKCEDKIIGEQNKEQLEIENNCPKQTGVLNDFIKNSLDIVIAQSISNNIATNDDYKNSCIKLLEVEHLFVASCHLSCIDNFGPKYAYKDSQCIECSKYNQHIYANQCITCKSDEEFLHGHCMKKCGYVQNRISTPPYNCVDDPNLIREQKRTDKIMGTVFITMAAGGLIAATALYIRDFTDFRPGKDISNFFKKTGEKISNIDWNKNEQENIYARIPPEENKNNIFPAYQNNFQNMNMINYSNNNYMLNNNNYGFSNNVYYPSNYMNNWSSSFYYTPYFSTYGGFTPYYMNYSPLYGYGY